MKKFIKSAVIFAAMVFAASCFVSCSNGNDEGVSAPGNGSGTVTPNPDKPETGGNTEWDDSSLKEAVLWVVGDSTVCDYMK